MKVWHEPIPLGLFNKLKDACIERRKDEDWDYNNKLVGALNQQSSLVATEGLEDYLTKTSENIWHTFFQTCPHKGVFNPNYLDLRELWVNYQKPGQYNPYHCHHGVVSFVIFVDIPLLFENNLDKNFDIVLCVISKKKIRTERVIKNKKFTKQILKKIFKSQTSDKNRKTRSQIIIYNNKTKKDFIFSIEKALIEILK